MDFLEFVRYVEFASYRVRVGQGWGWGRDRTVDSTQDACPGE